MTADDVDRVPRRESTLVELGRLALGGSPLAELVGRVAEILGDAVACDAAVVAVRGDGGGIRLLGATAGGDGRTLPSEVTPDTLPAVDEVLRLGGTRQCADLPEAVGGFVSCAVSAVTGRVGQVGALAVLDRRRRVYTADELDFVETVARAVGEAERRHRAEAELVERVKEQTAVAAVARLVQAHPPRAHLLEGVAAALAPALQYPDLTGVLAHVDGEEAAFGPADLAVELRVPVRVGKDLRGHLRVGYTEDRPFLDEERSLLHTVAESLAGWIAADDAMAARARSEERLRMLLEQQPGYVWTTDRDLVLTSVVGTPVGTAAPDLDAVGTPVVELAARRGVEVPVEIAHRQALGGEPATFTWDRDDQTFHAQVRPLRDQEGAIVGVVGSATDITAERRAEDAIRRSEERLRALVERASDVVAIVDTDFTIRFVSPPIQRMMGHAPEEVVGRRITEFIPERDLDTLADHWGHVLATDEPVGPLVHRLRYRDGTWRYVEVVHTNRTADPAVGGVIVNVRDVTERVEVQRALRESEERFRRLAENAPDMIYRIGLHPEPHFEYLSPAVEEVIGYPPEYFYADPARGRGVMTHPEQSILALDPDVDGPLTAVLEMIHRDGSLRYVERRAVVVRDREGRPVAVEAIGRDVTESRRTERALRASEGRLARVLETMTEGLLMFDAGGTLTYVNPAAEAIFEASWDELVGRRYDDPAWALLDGDGRPLPPERRVVHRVLETGQPLSSVVLARRRSDGTLIAWETNATPMPGAGEDDGGMILSLRDVTDRLRADRAVRDALDREREATEHLRQVDHMKTAFLQAVSHELRTPLTSVLGFSVLLQRHAELPSGQIDLLTERLTSNARKLDTLLADLLDVDRLSRGVLEARRSDVDVSGLLHHVVGDLDLDTDRVEVHGGDVTARIDGPRTERIVENLVLNALRHTEGPVEVDAEITPAGLRLTVADRGEGIPDDVKDDLFEPFRQGDTPAARVGGAGIGLTVVRTFAELHGGRAWVEDRPGGGSRFCVLLPTPTPSPTADASPVDAA